MLWMGKGVVCFFKSGMAFKLAKSAGVAVVRHGAKWTPYYIVKIGVMKKIQHLGARASYHAIVQKACALIPDPEERSFVLARIREGFRVPAAMLTTVKEVDAFLTDIVIQKPHSDEPPICDHLRTIAKVTLVANGKPPENLEDGDLQENECIPTPAHGSPPSECEGTINGQG
mmetsp:Transcript_1783/g.3429  ORF Transcript_1783/g.3429 Transcript_1783/m.3429 type:complete len:172 (-) Transcript_1783:261-776(-)